MSVKVFTDSPWVILPLGYDVEKLVATILIAGAKSFPPEPDISQWIMGDTLEGVIWYVGKDEKTVVHIDSVAIRVHPGRYEELVGVKFDADLYQ